MVVRFTDPQSSGGGSAVVVTPVSEVDPLKDRGVTAVTLRYDFAVEDLTFESAEICLPYDREVFAAQGRPVHRVRLLHTSSGVESDITTHLVANSAPPMACGHAPHFSDFQVAVYAGERIGGTDRYATAAQLAQRLYPDGAPVVYVATGQSFPDALTAGVAAGNSDAPLLLVTRSVLPAATRDALRVLAPSRVIVAGGPGAVSDAVVAEIARVTGAEVERIDGLTRYETATALALAQFPDGVSTVYVATGSNFPDAAAAGAAAARNGSALLLTRPDVLPEQVAAALRALDPDRVILVGGPQAVSVDVEQALQASVPGAIVERVFGVDRYGTAAALAAGDRAGHILAVTGLDFADAFVGTTMAAQLDAPVILVAGDRVPAVVAQRVATIGPEQMVVIGGVRAVGPQAELRLTRLLPEYIPDQL